MGWVAGIALTVVLAQAPEQGAWRTQPASGFPGKVHVVRSDGSQVTVGQGLADVKRLRELGTRVRALDDRLGTWGRWAARLAVGAVSLGLSASGVALLTAGVVMWVVSKTELNNQVVGTPYEFVVAQAPGAVLGGAVGAASGLVTALALLALVTFNATHAPPPDPRLLRQLSDSTLWDDPDQAASVVAEHNQRVGAAP